MSDLSYSTVGFLDLEAQCWYGPPPNGLKNDIIQFGLVEVNSINLSIKRSKAYYVRPKKCEISSYCKKLTGITFETIKEKGRPFDHTINTIQKEFSPQNKIYYAWGNDKHPIIETCAEFGITNPFLNIIDLGIMYRQFFNIKQKTSLQNAIKHLGLEFEGNAHDAEVDAINTARVYMEIVRRIRQ